jgi:two-component system, LytTR family, response regulator
METTNRILIGARRSILPQEIILFTANANYTEVHLSGGHIMTVATTLKIIEKRFAKCSEFFRTHKSYFINLNYIKRYHSLGEETFVQMKNDYRVVISRRKRGAFNRKLKEL